MSVLHAPDHPEAPALDGKGDIFGHGVSSRPVFWIGVVFSLFQVATASGILPFLSSQVVRSFHVGFLLLMVFAICATLEKGRPLRSTIDWLLGGLAFALAFYQWIFEADLIQRSGDLTREDMIYGLLLIAFVFEGARRLMGWPLPVICGIFVLYALFGEHLSGLLGHRPYGLDQVVNQYSFGTEGIFGTPVYVSSSYIFLFILFGSFLEQAGMVRLFTDVALGTVGHTKGGPAKVSVISSGLMGTINGSGVANVVTTGQFTIPLMKRFGYRPAFAGGVEATASMGGQIMPPVMGAVAFIMAETLNISYAEVCIAALVPAMLYFATAFWMVHLEAGRCSLTGLPKDECPSAWQAIREKGFLILPLVVLVTLLFSGYTPLFSGTVGLALTVLVILGGTVTGLFSARFKRILFWLLLGGLAGVGFKSSYGIFALYGLVGVMLLVNAVIAGGRETLQACLRALADGARAAVPVGIACALVGTIIGTMTLTGAAGTFTQAIVSLAGGSLFLTLFLTMITCLILGMGIPTIPNYIITSSLVAPILLKLGVPLLVSHMFVFYFGIMADLTPPVALAAFAASTVAKSPAFRTSLEAVRVAIAGFVVPYMAVYDNELLLMGGDPLGSAYVIGKAILAIVLWGSGAIGYLRAKLQWPERIIATAGAFSLVVANPISDWAGFGLAAVFFAYHYYRTRTLGRVAT